VGVLTVTLQLNAGVNPFQRKFVNDVRRCEEMERKLRTLNGLPFHCADEYAAGFLSKEIERAGLKIQEDVLELDTSAHRSQQEAQELEVIPLFFLLWICLFPCKPYRPTDQAGAPRVGDDQHEPSRGGTAEELSGADRDEIRRPAC